MPSKSDPRPRTVNPNGWPDGGKDLWKRSVLSLKWKVEGVTDHGENEGGDCDDWWGEPGGEWSEQNEVDGMKKGADSIRKEMHI